MHTLFKYIRKYCHETIDERPLGPEDSVVLTALSYLVFENVMNYTDVYSLQELDPVYDELAKGSVLPPLIHETLELCLASRRFKDIVVEKPYFIADLKAECSISAVTFRFSKNLIVVAFRGTDLSLLAWKEDLILGYNDTITGHIEATNYLTDVITANPGNLVYVCGHSKGGNLSAYSTCKIDPELSKQIVNVFDLDGPGFRNNFFNEPDFIRMEEKFIRLLPHDDLVGQLLNHNPDYRVVKSYRLLKVAQHAQFIWKFKNGRLAYANDVSAFTKRFSWYLRRLMEATPHNEIRVLIEDGFKIFEDAGIVYLTDFFKLNGRKRKKLSEGYWKLPAEKLVILKHILYQFAKVYLLAEFDIFFFFKNSASFRRRRFVRQQKKIIENQEKQK